PEMLGRQYLERADIVVLQTIKDQLGKRPIYFSRTIGMYADQFGFTSRLEGHGFARVLRVEDLKPSGSIRLMPQLGYVNVPRTTTWSPASTPPRTSAQPAVRTPSVT